MFKPLGRLSHETRVTGLVSLAMLLLIGLATLFPLMNAYFFGGEYSLHEHPDSNVRLAQIRSLLAGQGWFDLEMKNFGLMGGTPMHWSRLVDLVPAAMIVLFSTLMPMEQAEDLMVVIYPILLLLPFVYAMIWTGRRLFPQVPIVALSVLMCVTMVQLPWPLEHFLPSRIDHHNLQLIALVVMLGAMSGTRDFKSGLIAACGLVGGLVVGLDALPVQVAAIAALGLLWISDAHAEDNFVRGLGVGIVALAPIAGVIFIPRPDAGQWCDSWTVPMSTIIFGFGLYLLFVAFLTRRVTNMWVRAGVAAGAGAMWFGVLLWLNPACINPKPLPTDNLLINRYWMDLVGETKPLWFRVTEENFGIGIYVLTGLSLVFGAFALRRRLMPFRPTAIYLAATCATLLYAIKFYRALPIMAALIVPILAYAIHLMVVRFKQAQRLPILGQAFWIVFPALFVLACNNLVSGAVHAAHSRRPPPLLVQSVDAGGAAQHSDATPQNIVTETQVPSAKWTPVAACVGATERAALQDMPAGRMLSGFLSNEYLIYATHHHQMFGGYHRNYKDVLEIIHWLIAPPDQAHARFTQHKIDYFFYCPQYSQMPIMGTDYPGSFVGQVVQGKPLPWLVPILKLQRGGMVYRIVPRESSGS